MSVSWSKIFADRTSRMKASDIRELLKLTARPEIISLAGGLPAPELFPLDEYRRAFEERFGFPLIEVWGMTETGPLVTMCYIKSHLADNLDEEALLDTILVNGGQGLRRSIDINDEDHPVAGQIIGSEPQTMAKGALLLAQAGYDVIDLNFACPVKKIKNKARGGHMLRDVPRAVITHAHGDHARPGSGAYLTAQVGAAILRRRLGEDAAIARRRRGEVGEADPAGEVTVPASGA